MRLKTLSYTTFALCSVGFVISGYLLYRYIAITTGGAEAGATDVCSLVFGQGCDATLRSPSSFLLGIPMSGWGIVYFAMLLSTLLLGSYLREPFISDARLLAFFTAIGGIISSIVLAGMMLTGNVFLCPLCMLVHVINVGILWLLWQIIRRSGHSARSRAFAWFRYLARGRSADIRQARWKVTVACIPFLIGACMYQWVFIETGARSSAFIDPAAVIEAYSKSSVYEIPVTGEDAVLGPWDAAHTLVVFSDFQCPSCRAFAQRVQKLTEQYPDKLRIVFKHFPLDPSCNQRMDRDLHQGACEAAFAAQAARRQEKFWEVHDVLFSTEMSMSNLDSLLMVAGADVARVRRDMQDTAIIRKVLNDIALTHDLQVRSTPALFLDGRRLEDRRPQVLSILIESID